MPSPVPFGGRWLAQRQPEPGATGRSTRALAARACTSRQAEKDRIRSDAEYDANLKSSLEVSQLHLRVDELHDKVLAQLATLGAAELYLNFPDAIIAAISAP
ncbi:MAG: hypothetical protein ACT4TC_23415 [Myxococcaceae bacterium]